MRTVLAATLMALMICGSPTLIYAAEDAPEGEMTETAPGNDAMSPAAPAQDEAVEGEGDQAPSGGDVMKNFTRHRPGACPEGPPCKMEDED